MLVIGVVGKQGAGKDTLSFHLQKLMEVSGKRKHTVASASFSSILKQMLKKDGLAITRSNLQALGRKISKTFLGSEMTKLVEKSKSDMFFITGMRTLSDYRLLRTFKNNLLIAVTAPARTRFQRLRNRGEKENEIGLKWKSFLKEENHPIEKSIDVLIAKADIKIANNSTQAAFKSKIKKILPKVKL